MATPMLNCCSFQKGMYLPNGFDPPTDSCPPIIGYYATINDAPDGTNVGDLAVERYVDGDGNQHIHLYEWDGAVWVEKFGTSFRVEDGLITEMSVEVAEPPYQISVDGGLIWDNQSVTFDPPVATVDVWFRNNVTGCIYSNIPQIPLAIYCVESYLADNSIPNFNLGLINGVDAGDLGAVLASYTNWDSNPTAIPSVTNGAGGLAIVIFRDSATPAFTNMGVYTPFDGPPTVDWTPSVINCTRNCYEGVFTVVDLATDSFTGVVFGTGEFDITFDSPLIDPTTAATAYLAGLIAAAQLEPTATLTITLNGNEVTMTICTVRTLVSGYWSDNPETHGGSFNFTLI